MIWIARYQRLLGQRDALLKKLEGLPQDQLNQRPKPHSWAIDEILRHQIGSEVRYVQQVLDETLPQSDFVVPAQWVGNILFRLEEREHMALDRLVAEFERIQTISADLLQNVTENTENAMVKAPWGQQVPTIALLEHFFDHDIQHQGQIQYLYTYFAGPPDFVKPDESVKYG